MILRKMILLMNFGGPRSRVEIPIFLENLTGRTPTPVALEIAARRYEAIGGSSPLPALTEELARVLTSCVDTDTRVEAAFMYSHPTIEEVVRECNSSQVAEIVFFVLSPFYTTRTTGAFVRAAEDSLARLPDDYRPATRFIHSWFAQPPFVDWWVEELRKTAEYSPDAFFLFSAHSMPVAVEHDLYRSQVKEVVRLVADKSRLSSYALAWQSAPVQTMERWTGPSVEKTLESLARRGVRSVIEVPIGFLIENLETLYDIDIVHKKCAEDLGLKHQRLVCPNTDPRFIQALSSMFSCFMGESH